MEKSSNKLAYSIVELAEIAGVGRSFIYEEIKIGRLKIKKAGRRTLILHADVAAWLRDLPELAPGNERSV